MSLQVNIEKKLGSFRLRMDFCADNGVTALLGASGCGKSMTLKCIAGVERPDRGRIVLGDRVLFDSEKGICLPPQKRKVGYLFQQYALFPNMTVRQNIMCGVRTKEKRKEAVERIIRTMRLEGAEEKKPSQLSGGQQQRVALARILVNEPDVLLFDEPFSALDSHLRFQMEEEVRRVIHEFRKPVVLVSHNRDEVFRLSDTIAVMGEGTIEQLGGRHQVFASPGTLRAAVMTGCKNISRAALLSGSRVRAEDWGIDLTLSSNCGILDHIGIRMHDIRPAGDGDTENVFVCRVDEEIENPFSYTLMLRPADSSAPVLLGWETDKNTWRRLRAAEVRVCLPPETLLPLKA